MNTDTTKTSSKPLEDLPDYLGLGVLDTNSIEKSQEKVSGLYKFENEVIYQVSVSADNFQIVELLDGQVIATTTEHESLSNTFFQHLTSQLPYQSKRFERLFRRLTNNRNLIVRFAVQPRFFYYPAGYLFSLRQPILVSNKPMIDQLVELSANNSDPSSLKLSSIRDGVILRLLQNGEVTVEQIKLADFSCTLHRLASSVDLIWQSGMVPKEKEYKLMVLDSSLSGAGNLSIYLGDISRGFITYSVVVTEGFDLDLEKTQGDFRNSSLQLLERIKKQKNDPT